MCRLNQEGSDLIALKGRQTWQQSCAIALRTAVLWAQCFFTSMPLGWLARRLANAWGVSIEVSGPFQVQVLLLACLRPGPPNGYLAAMS